MNVNLQNMQTIQQQMATGKNFSKPSDDPFGVADSMQMNTAINANKQYNTNITNVSNWLNTTDTALGELDNVYQSIRENLVSSGNAAYSSSDLQSIKDQVNQQVGQIAQILNTNFNGQYIFGGSQADSKPMGTTVDANGNTELTYIDKNGNSIQQLPTVASQTVTPANWSGKSITFQVTPSGGGSAVSGTITLDTFQSNATVSDVVKDITSKLNSYSTGTPPTNPLAGEIDVSATSTGAIKFTSLTSDTVNITSTGGISDLSSVAANTQLSSAQLDNIASSRKTEISQGVPVTYNVSATDVLNFGSSNNLSTLLKTIVSDLDSSNTSSLTGQDLTNLDSAMSQLLSVRSQVGAKQNAMTSAQNRNQQSNTDMTNILSSLEDVDMTKETMNYANAQTVYMASLETSAKVIEPTLMDYLK
jgi:flagellar hook-associated protein 3 FlgL